MAEVGPEVDIPRRASEFPFLDSHRFCRGSRHPANEHSGVFHISLWDPVVKPAIGEGGLVSYASKVQVYSILRGFRPEFRTVPRFMEFRVISVQGLGKF